MFRIDTGMNRICPLEAKHFAELGFGGRQHLQEWIANFPQALGKGKGKKRSRL